MTSFSDHVFNLMNDKKFNTLKEFFEQQKFDYRYLYKKYGHEDKLIFYALVDDDVSIFEFIHFENLSQVFMRIFGINLLQYTISNNYINVFKYIRDNYPNDFEIMINQQTNISNETPLHRALDLKRFKFADILAHHPKTDFTLLDFEGKSVCDYFKPTHRLWSDPKWIPLLTFLKSKFE